MTKASVDARAEAAAMKQVRAAKEALKRLQSLDLQQIRSTQGIELLSTFQDDLTSLRDNVAVRVVSALPAKLKR